VCVPHILFHQRSSHSLPLRQVQRKFHYPKISSYRPYLSRSHRS
jgi:hypothetical protein